MTAQHEVSEITRQLIERDQRGRAKYGTSLDRTDLSLPDWLQHMAEELLDAAGYALAAKREAQQPETTALYQHLLGMLGVKTHQEAGAEIGRLHALAQQPAAVVDDAELRAISREMRERMVCGGKYQSNTLVAWADRIDAAIAIERAVAVVDEAMVERAKAAVAYSHNFATAKPNIGSMEREHILGLCGVIVQLTATLAGGAK